MNTPIVDFVRKYADTDVVRLHMPGHKGIAFSGMERYDITEIDGADVLYSAQGIIRESENNAASVFNSFRTYYSTEGSSLCIKAMLAMVLSEKNADSERPIILATRNAHKAFIYSAVLLDFDIEWLYPDEFEHICSCKITADELKRKLSSMDALPDAVYVTSPDYLGNILDIKAIADVCGSFDVPLLVDNAHGAYLRFLDKSLHPIDLGAYMCCDSAHKTLPVLTSGAYLHLSHRAASLEKKAEEMLSLFASTSPSYLILQSLDRCNSYLCENYNVKLKKTEQMIDEVKSVLRSRGYVLYGNEPLKVTIDSRASGLLTQEILSAMKKDHIIPEFYDRNYVVLMFSAENTRNDVERLTRALCALSPTSVTAEVSPFKKHSYGKKIISIRSAFFAPKRKTSVRDAVGRICADVSVGCPPAIPVTVCGEIITEDAVEVMLSFGIDEIKIVSE